MKNRFFLGIEKAFFLAFVIAWNGRNMRKFLRHLCAFLFFWGSSRENERHESAADLDLAARVFSGETSAREFPLASENSFSSGSKIVEISFLVPQLLHIRAPLIIRNMTNINFKTRWFTGDLRRGWRRFFQPAVTKMLEIDGGWRWKFWFEVSAIWMKDELGNNGTRNRFLWQHL